MSSKWHMTDEEIRKSWRRCEDKHEQIRILAELNCKTKPEVIERLRILGIEVPEDLVRQRTRFSEIDDRRIWLSRMEGRPYTDIAGKMRRITSEAVRNRYMQLLQEHTDARPVLEKALLAYTQTEKSSEEERAIIEKQLRRGI